MRVSDYLANPTLFAGRRPYVINLARSYAYQGAGYYAALLAEARGHRVSPTVQTMVELSRKDLYAHALPDLNARLADTLAKGVAPAETVFIAFSKTAQTGYERLAREVSDWFRTPALELEISLERTPRITRIRPVSLNRMSAEQRAFFLDALGSYTRTTVRNPKARAPAKWSLAVLVDPHEHTPPSQPSDINRLIDVAARWAWMWKCSTPMTCRASPSLTPSSSGRPLRSTISPIVSPAAPIRKACRSSMIPCP